MTAITMANQNLDDDMALDESGQPVQKKKKLSLSGIFNKVADMAGRAAVTNTLKLAAVTTLAGLGASSFMTIGTAAAASALGSALYVYGKETALEWRKAKREDRAMQWWDADRSRKVKFALLTGAAGGAFGAWLAGTEFFKAGLELAKEAGAKVFDFIMPAAHAAEPASLALGVATAHTPAANISMDNFNARFDAAFAKPSPFGTLDPHAFAPAPAHAPTAMDNFNLRWNAAFDKPPVTGSATGPFGALDTQAFQPKLDLAHIDLAQLPVTAPAPTAGDIWAKVLDVAARSHHGHNALSAIASKVHGGADCVTPQMLKDSAHDVLRLQDIPWQERLTLARQLAEEAQARGNHQAGQFLKDLLRLEHGAKPHFNVAHHVKVAPHPVAAVHEAVHVETAAPPPDAFVTADAPQIDLPQTDVAGTAPLLPVETQPLPPVVAPPPVTATFTEAAKCTVVTDNGASSVACIISRADMHAGDYVSFVAAENPAIKSTTSLLQGSVDVPTQSFLHERVVADGVAKVNALRAAKPGA